MNNPFEQLIEMGTKELIRQERNSLIQNFMQIIEDKAQNSKDVKELEKALLEWCVRSKENRYLF